MGFSQITILGKNYKIVGTYIFRIFSYAELTLFNKKYSKFIIY
ncbi:hypothetical protein LEP1GSC173_3747 [Leptospira interrogans str. HAI1594]|uniref:Uncharacterized protein n=1 Tax=Leptospira interrogans serovar Hardjo str. Norma TaxID=1279460 RepID=A0A0M4NCW2_LEPIR|nr:hypothetical protein G436_4432 [Leptospira interrogans serovar Hardjo str. Norma]EKP76608.1 hypothetical protein LEP1GSC173_3747 [Leptospira interrogans str. HAI1594]